MFNSRLIQLADASGALLLCRRFRSVLIGWLERRVDDAGKSDEVVLKRGNLRCQAAIDTQDFPRVPQGFLGRARSVAGCRIQQDLVQCVQIASQLIQVNQEEQVELERLLL